MCVVRSGVVVNTYKVRPIVAPPETHNDILARLSSASRAKRAAEDEKEEIERLVGVTNAGALAFAELHRKYGGKVRCRRRDGIGTLAETDYRAALGSELEIIPTNPTLVPFDICPEDSEAGPWTVSLCPTSGRLSVGCQEFEKPGYLLYALEKLVGGSSSMYPIKTAFLKGCRTSVVARPRSTNGLSRSIKIWIALRVTTRRASALTSLLPSRLWPRRFLVSAGIHSR